VRLSGRRTTRTAARAVPHRLLDGDRPHCRRAPRRARPLGRLLPPAAQAAARAAVRRRRSRRVDAGVVPAGRGGRRLVAPAHTVAALRSVELTLALVSLALLLRFAMLPSP